ncbi:MAG: STAS domain-containing protein [Planctomycetaceae bacterium]
MTEALPCELETHASHAYVRVRPALSDQGWAAIDESGQQVVSELEARPAPACVVDLSELNYMGSALVAFVVRIWKVTRTKQGKMAVVCSNATVLEVIQLAGLDKVWDICDDRDAALERIGIRVEADVEPVVWPIPFAVIMLLAAVVCIGLAKAGSLGADLARTAYIGVCVAGAVVALIGALNMAGKRRWFSILLTLAAVGMLVPAFQENMNLFAPAVAEQNGGDNVQDEQDRSVDESPTETEVTTETDTVSSPDESESDNASTVNESDSETVEETPGSQTTSETADGETTTN